MNSGIGLLLNTNASPKQLSKRPSTAQVSNNDDDYDPADCGRPTQRQHQKATTAVAYDNPIQKINQTLSKKLQMIDSPEVIQQRLKQEVLKKRAQQEEEEKAKALQLKRNKLEQSFVVPRTKIIGGSSKAAAAAVVKQNSEKKKLEQKLLNKRETKHKEKV